MCVFMRRLLFLIAKSVGAGFMICLAAIVYLRCNNNIVGSALFAFGLLTICVWGMKLFTGFIGYLADKRNPYDAISYLWKCIVVWLGNFTGCALAASWYRCTEAYESIKPIVNGMVALKCQATLYSLGFLGILCGFLMHLAVHTWKQYKLAPLIRVCMVFLPVVVFILSGFEHSIADMAYVMLSSDVIMSRALIILVIVTLGNTAGGLYAAWLLNIIQKEKQEEKQEC